MAEHTVYEYKFTSRLKSLLATLINLRNKYEMLIYDMINWYYLLFISKYY